MEDRISPYVAGKATQRAGGGEVSDAEQGYNSMGKESGREHNSTEGVLSKVRPSR